MKDQFLLPGTGSWYKANLHCHTVLSDGKLTPEEVKAAYQGRGYSVVAYTDHDYYEYHHQLCDEGFVALAAYEVAVNEPLDSGTSRLKRKTYHINFYDTDPLSNAEEKKAAKCPEHKYYDIGYINHFVAEMNERGFLACYNHPYWSMQTYQDYKNLEQFWAMEIYNHGCEHDGLYGYHPQAYNEILQLGKRWFCLATDDNHNEYPFDDPLCDSFGGFTMICARELTYGAIIEAMRAGHFYSSMGPEIKALNIVSGSLHVKTSPVEKIFVHMDGRRCYKKLAAAGETITEAVFPLSGEEGFIWVECRDENGKFANTNACSITE